MYNLPHSLTKFKQISFVATDLTYLQTIQRWPIKFILIKQQENIRLTLSMMKC